MKKISTEKIKQKLQKKIKAKITEVNTLLMQQRRNALSEDCKQFFRDCCNCCGCFVCGEEDSEQVRIETLLMDIIDISTGTYDPSPGDLDPTEIPIHCLGMEQEGLVLHLNTNETAWGVGPVYGAPCTPFTAGCSNVQNPITGEWEGYQCFARRWEYVPIDGVWQWRVRINNEHFDYSVSCSLPTPLSLALGDCYRFKLSTREFGTGVCWSRLAGSTPLEPLDCSCCRWVYERSPRSICDCCQQPRSPLALDGGRLQFVVTCG